MKLKSSISRRSPQLFLVAGIIGFVGTAVTAVMKSDKVKPIIKDAKDELAEVPTPGSRSKLQIVSKAAFDISKEMAIPIGLATVSTGCLLKSYNLMNAKHLAAVGTIDILNTSLKTYKKAVEEEVGEDTAKKIDDRIIRKEITRQLDTICKGDGHVTTDTESFSRYFSKETSNKYPEGGADTVLPFLKSAETYFNQLLHNRERFGRTGVVRYNEVLDYLGFSKVPEGETAGWLSKRGSGFVDFGIAGAYYADYDGVLDRYNCVVDTGKIPREDSGYMLCFNVDPYIVK